MNEIRLLQVARLCRGGDSHAGRGHRREHGDRPSRRKAPRSIATIPVEDRRSTAASLLTQAPGWTGDDLQDVIATVRGTRTKTRF